MNPLQRGMNHFVDTRLVVHGAGRVPNCRDRISRLRGVAFSKNGIDVDPFLRSVSNPAVFAAGDCANTPTPRLTPVANEQARMVVRNLFTETPTGKPDYGVVPRVVFTSPCLAAIGILESEATAAESGIDPDIRFENTSTWSSVRKTCQECAAYKLIIDKSSDRIPGAHLLGPAAEETINLFALAMKFNLTATNLKSTLFAFPTFGSDVRQMV